MPSIDGFFQKFIERISENISFQSRRSPVFGEFFPIRSVFIKKVGGSSRPVSGPDLTVWDMFLQSLFFSRIIYQPCCFQEKQNGCSSKKGRRFYVN